MAEPSLKTVAHGGKLNLAMLGRIVRRIEGLHDRIDATVSERTYPAQAKLTEPRGKVRLDSSYLIKMLQRIENAWSEINSFGYSSSNALPLETPLKTEAVRGRLELSVVNRIIRRIEYLWSLEMSAGGSGYSA